MKLSPVGVEPVGQADPKPKHEYKQWRSLPRVTALPVFDFAAFFAAFDGGRRDRGLSWYEFADELWRQSSELNSHRADHPL
jgi:hypothetical protein